MVHVAHRSPAGRDRERLLADALVGVDGWLHPREAAALYDAASSTCTDLVVEIGSYHGRSTICLALGVRAGGCGRVLAIDPGALEPDQQSRLERNLARAGIRDLVEVIDATSHDARPRVADGSVGVLFVDGSHAYEDVVQDVTDWSSALAVGAVAAFNDPFWTEVSRSLRDTVAGRGSAYRSPRWVDKTVFFTYRPDLPWQVGDTVRAWRLRAFLKVGRVWWRWHEQHAAGRSGRDQVSVLAIRAVSSLLLPGVR